VAVRPDHDVVRLDVAMHDPRGVRGRESLGHSFADVDRLFDRERLRQPAATASVPRRIPWR
jgi:hypothetical protein